LTLENYSGIGIINKIDDSLLENFYEELNEFLEKSKENNYRLSL
jgi:hypothetical protein